MKPDADRVRGLHVLADDAPHWRWNPVEQARAACEGGASVVQLRAKHAADREVLEWARQIRVATRDAGVLFIVNDRFDLALAALADGVHLGQDDLPPARVPAAARARLLIGRSTHTAPQAREAAAEPVDYVAFGPVFGTGSKSTPWSARGTSALPEIARIASPRPLVAIGGIDTRNAALLRPAGAAAAAVISAVANAPDPPTAVRALVRILGAGASSTHARQPRGVESPRVD